MEVLIHSQNTHLHFQNTLNTCSSIPSNSSETYQNNTPSIEIHVHSQDVPINSSSSSSSFCQLHEVQTSIVQSEPMEAELTWLLPSHAIKGLEFTDRVANGRLEWKESSEEQFNGSASTSIGMNETSGLGAQLVQRIGGRTGHHYQNTNHGLTCITDPSLASRIRVAFDPNVRNLDGRITEKEIKQAILWSASTNKLSISHEAAGEYARLIAEELDCGDQGFVELPNLGDQLTKASLPIEPIQGMPESNLDRPMRSPAIVLFRAHWRRAWMVSIWLIACLALFTWKFMQYQRRSAFEVMGFCLCTAKGAAETLKLNMALVLLPVCRNTLTWLRKSRWIGSIVPFNDNINFHKLIAGGIVVGVILHGGTHLTCDFPRIAGANRSVFRRTIAADFQHRQPSYVEILATTEGATGIAMVAIMAVAFLLATRPSRRRRPASPPGPIGRFTGFNAFWYSHHLFVVVYVLLIVHSMFLFLTKDVTEKTTWMYIAIPVLLYAAERVVRTIRAGVYDVKILKANLYPGKVLSMKLRKPAGFRYRSGMYIFVQCPQISKFEWHPFSLTSAPDDDYLSVHIRTVGDWSNQIYSLFQGALVLDRCDFPKICIDGPYGAASQDHINYDIVLLIGLGIGATPFISILKDITHGLQKLLPKAGSADDDACDARGPTKAYFYWVTREQSSFEWFRDIMREVSIANRRKAVIEMHNYLTSVSQEGDKRSVLISAIQALHLAKSGIDIISRMPVRTQFARPNWVGVFSALARKHREERIGVFYCGPEALARELESLCYKMTTKTGTRFVFHKEYY